MNSISAFNQFVPLKIFLNIVVEIGALIVDFAIWQVLNNAREKFTQEISFQSKDRDISLAKVNIYESCSALFVESS